MMNDYSSPMDDSKPSEGEVDLLEDTRVRKRKPWFKTRTFLYGVIAVLVLLVVIFFALFLRLALKPKPTLPEFCKEESCISAASGNFFLSILTSFGLYNLFFSCYHERYWDLLFKP